MPEATIESMREYYARRASSYERVYHKIERQDDLRAIEAWLPQHFKDRRVLELACGTGWWTTFGARDCARWLATDANPEVIEIARGKPLPPGKVRFALTDAFSLAELGPARFDAAFAGFWWSHVPLKSLAAWLDVLHSRLEPGSPVVMLDNLFVPGSSTPLHRRDAHGNTYQNRALDDAGVTEVLKNFPSRGDVHAALGRRAKNFRWYAWQYYWACSWQAA
jgi:SAM-dependent methyltransferase